MKGFAGGIEGMEISASIREENKKYVWWTRYVWSTLRDGEWEYQYSCAMESKATGRQVGAIGDSRRTAIDICLAQLHRLEPNVEHVEPVNIYLPHGVERYK